MKKPPSQLPERQPGPMHTYIMMTHRDKAPEVVAGRLDKWQRELMEFQRRMGIDR